MTIDLDALLRDLRDLEERTDYLLKRARAAIESLRKRGPPPSDECYTDADAHADARKYGWPEGDDL